MKNQVNKKVSKLLIALLSLVIMSVACVSLAACNKECTHSKFKLSEDTATCVAGGFITHTCEDCGYAYMEPTPAKGHDYGTAEVVPATCTTDGYTVKTCKTCGFEEKSDATKATGHLHTSEVTVAATCIANGSKKVVCQDCGTVVSEETLLATGHAYVDEAVAATCGFDGYTIRTCATCGDIQYVKGAPATGNHNYEEVSRIDATCKTAGTVLERCTVCDKEKTTLLPVSDVHTFGEMTNVSATCQEAAHREQTCKICGYVEKTDFTGDVAPHAFSLISETKATCTSKGVTVEECDYCGKKQITETDKLSHTYGEATTVAATCEAEGSKYYTCEVCGHKDVIETYDKLGHDFSEVAAEVPATCTAAGFKTMMCSRCGKNGATTVLNKLDHEYDEAKKVVVAATCTTGGYTLETCKLCGNQFTTATTEAAGHDWEMTRRLEATCTEDGEVLSTCKACSTTKIDVIEAAGHQYTDMVKDATCTEGAMAYQLCTVCGATTEYVPVEGSEAIGHNFEVVLGATCQDNGYEVCTNCGEELTLDKIDHTYAIADSIYEKVDINVYFAEGGKYAYLPEYAKENILAIYGAALEAEKLNEYCTVTTATCTEGGSTQKICDMCKVRYTDGNTAALGHNFGDAPVVYEATCYSEGYTAWECSRCHYQAGLSVAEIKSEVAPMTAHVMTIGEGETVKAIYAKYVAGVLTYFEDAECATQLTIAQCNVLAKDADGNKFVYYCDHCGALADENNKVATGTYETAGESAFTGRYEKIDGVTLKVYATTEIMTEAGKLASAEHNFEGAEAVIDPSELITCGYVSKSIISCLTCGGATGAFAQYNLTAAQTTEETYTRPAADGETVNVNKFDTEYTEHYEMYSYRMYYHVAVEIAEGAACVTPTKYVYTCGRNAIEGVQAECQYYLEGADEIGYAEANETYADKLLPKSVANDEGEITYTLVEKVTSGYIKSCADAYAAALTEAGETDKAEEFAGRAYDILWDETFEDDMYNVFLAKDPAGHKFETEYVIVSFNENEDGTFTYTERSCDAKKLIVLTKCSVCNKYNYINDELNTEGIGATDKIQSNGEESLLVNNENAVANVAHGVAKTDEAGKLVVVDGKFEWINVAYRNAFNVPCEAEDDGAIAYAYNPNATCEADCTETHEHVYKCAPFTCEVCGEDILTSHRYDVATSDCYHSQNCVFCGIQIKSISHKEPDITCHSEASNDGYYHCEICDAPIKLLTPHNIVITVVTEATCTTDGLWTAKCSICGLKIDKDYLEAQAKAGIEVKVRGLEEGNTTNAAYLEKHTVTVVDGVAVLTADMLVDTALGHDWAEEFTIDTPATCEEVGSKSKHCSRCDVTSEVTEIPATGHSFVTLDELKAMTAEEIATLYGEGFEAYKEATCAEDGFFYLICKNGCHKYENAEGTAVAEADAKQVISKETVAHTWGAYEEVEAATCVNPGSEKRTCEVCGKEETQAVAALGHDFTLEVVKTNAEGVAVKADCTLGYVVKAFKCAHEGCDIDSKYIYEEGTDEPKKVIYQRDVETYLTDKGINLTVGEGKDGKLVDGAYDGNFYHTEEKNGSLDFTETEHVLTTFDMDPGHLLYELLEFIAPSYDEEDNEVKGSAYWLCANCGARVYVKDSVTMAMYNDPAINTDWQTKVAPNIAEIKVTGYIALDSTLTKSVYFTSTPTGFAFKSEKIDEVVDMLFAKLQEKLAENETLLTVSINGSANTALDFAAADTVKETLKTLLTNATIITEINVTIAE